MRTDLTALNEIADHPRVRTTRHALAEAEQRQSETEAKCAAAEADLHAAERAAAAGRRDDKQLRTVREQAMHWQGEMRIAAHAVVSARRAAEEAYRDACVEIHAAFTEAHRAAITRLGAALAEARRHSHEATALEDITNRLFSGGVYRKWPGRALPAISWTRVFGSPDRNQDDTQYVLWRKCCGVFND